jgi:hypothetical protein
LTPVEASRGSVRRAEATATHLFDAGDDAGARRLLEDALAIARADDEQARVLYRLIRELDGHAARERPVSALSAWPSMNSRSQRRFMTICRGWVSIGEI